VNGNEKQLNDFMITNQAQQGGMEHTADTQPLGTPTVLHKTTWTQTSNTLNMPVLLALLNLTVAGHLSDQLAQLLIFQMTKLRAGEMNSTQ
jgi:hypothetical protein